MNLAVCDKLVCCGCVRLGSLPLGSRVLTGGADLQATEEGDSTVVNHHFVQRALGMLVPVLLEQLTKQEEGQDKDDGLWNLSMAAGTCLGLVATVVGDAIVNLVMPYVQVRLAACGGAAHAHVHLHL